MDQFSISQLSRFSGVKAHTIRIWEQRYNALRPHRSEGNTRYYDNTQLRRLLNIVSLSESGYRISQLGGMPDDELFSLIGEFEKGHKGDELQEFFISQFLAAGMDYDTAHFEKMFSQCLLRYGLKNSYIKVIYPLLERIGLMWAGNTIPPAREHFLSNLIRQKLFTAIDALPPEQMSKDSWLLFLPENEFHEIGLLFASYLIRSSGRKVIYLGTNVPFKSLQNAIEEIAPSKLLLFLVHNDLPENMQQYIEKLEQDFFQQKIFISGRRKLLEQLKFGKNTHHLKSVYDLEEALKPNYINE